VAQGAQVVADVQFPTGLDAGEHHFFVVFHVNSQPYSACAVRYSETSTASASDHSRSRP
jgi:hypothetical protein